MNEMQSDGSIVITAAVDTSEIRRGTEEIKRLITAMRVDAQKQFTAIRGSAITETTTASGQVKGILGTMMTDAAGVITAGQGTVVKASRSVMTAMQRELRSGAEMFVQIGGQMMTGVANGIRASSSVVEAAARQAASAALASMKRELGIRSPSTVAREEVGKPLGTGVAAGITQSSADLASASERAVARAASVISKNTGYPAAVSGSATKDASATLHTGQKSSASDIGRHQTTIVFTKPVETPAAHARALRGMMEDMLYGV